LSVLPEVENAQVGPPASGKTASPHWPFDTIGESMTIALENEGLGSVA